MVSLISFVYLNSIVFLCSWYMFIEPVKDTSWYCIECFICVSTSFIHILKFLIWFLMDLVLHFTVSVPEKFKIKVREIVLCNLRYTFLFISLRACVLHPNFARGLQVFIACDFLCLTLEVVSQYFYFRKWFLTLEYQQSIFLHFSNR